MEFERTIFRMHERCLIGPHCNKFVRIYQRCICMMFIYFLSAFVIYHKLYVNTGDILRGALEDQLLSMNTH